MPDDFLIARNPEPGSTLPYLIRLPLGPEGIVLKARDTWPRTSKIYCHRADAWPDDAEIVERTPTRSCTRRGAAIDLVLDRGRENRSQLVITIARGRQMIFWQSARTAKQARPAVRTPSARAQGRGDVQVVVDSHERYAWTFRDEQVTTVKRALTAGDYAVERDGAVVAAVERKSLADLVATLISGKMTYLLADLAALPRAAVVVEDRYSAVFKLDRVRPAVVADGLAECQARFPAVPIVFAETRQLAQQWAYRFLVACLDELDGAAEQLVADLPAAGPLPASTPRARPRREVVDDDRPPTAQVRAWAVAAGLPVADRGRLRPEVYAAYAAALRSP